MDESMSVEQMILEQVREINGKLDSIRSDLHAGERRMDAFERNIKLLEAADTKTDNEVAILKGKVQSLEPVIEIVGNMKKLFYAGAAVALLLSLLPLIMPYLSKMVK